LAWAFVEAAHFARRSDGQCRQWYDRKASKTNNVIATKALVTGGEFIPQNGRFRNGSGFLRLMAA